MGLSVSGHVTITCDTDAEFTSTLASVQATPNYTNITSDVATRTISFDYTATRA